MSGHHIKHITTVDVGTPPTGYSYEEWKTVEVHFHGFADLPSESVESPEFICVGHKWRLSLIPGGQDFSDPGMVNIYIKLSSDEDIDLMYVFTVKDSDGKEVAHYMDKDVYELDDDSFPPSFAKRSKIMDVLAEGTLIVEVRMKLDDVTSTPVLFIPENPLCKNILQKFMDEDSADVLFLVGSENEGGRGARKKAKTTLASFHAHHLILQDGAPTLAELCKSAKQLSPVRITDVKPDVFRHMLYYIYGGKVTDEELKANALHIMDAADQYGVVNLKLEAEACYARSITLTVDNMLDILLYADAKNCAFLKEIVVDFMVENGKDILGKVSFENVPSSMMTDILTAVTRGKDTNGDHSDVSDYNTMRVGTLRKKLHEKGLDIDGSREAMIALLKENS
mmetsp:Transcript_10964/g.20062  ORF Transcript_10964/g.20062 Transcript_10964/m.20062 type:complete len:395 (-) Transcript_10964:147-1331(-)|eukprot:CAMPEP_0201923198 /NCGR_PEP_ID=MMETSP0903-20130614/11010_1 /ASSEMBLY_ACC=CAM_ASM_000552 /TAXON_ID=420261 /ORGANISM="Thalassiosira antarctica, Strain CCMP982" /LENGTH=394 /DNA_ID=CAMNT_0048460475 /DNA_START=182 /DNA_END=1366 /DNA_ORIENTATION=-